MQTIGFRDLKIHLGEYVQRVRSGETIRVTSQGEVVAELRPPDPPHLSPSGGTRNDEALPAGLEELVCRGLADRVVRNDPSSYRRFDRLLSRTTSRELLDELRDDRR